MEILSKRLKELREEKKISTRKMASYLGISQSAYMFYENHNGEPTMENLVKLADFFSVTLDFLLGRTDY